LRQQEKSGTIKLIENKEETDGWKKRKNGLWSYRYGHGENLKMLLKACDAEFAVLFSSGIETLHTDWLDTFIAMLKTDKDLGAARFRPARNNFETSWVAPVWWPNLMFLNMGLYRKFMSDDDWDLARVPFDDFLYKHLFDGQQAPKNPDPEGMMVFLDTGYNLWKRLEHDNPKGYKMINFDTKPATFQWQNRFDFHIGLYRNSHRPEHPFVVSQRAKIQERLRILRCQS
jgi:hypothetical protein